MDAQQTIKMYGSITDNVWREMFRDRALPPAVWCAECRGRATFRDDHMAARYECVNCGHSVHPMWTYAAVLSGPQPAPADYRIANRAAGLWQVDPARPALIDWIVE